MCEAVHGNCGDGDHQYQYQGKCSAQTEADTHVSNFHCYTCVNAAPGTTRCCSWWCKKTGGYSGVEAANLIDKPSVAFGRPTMRQLACWLGGKPAHLVGFLTCGDTFRRFSVKLLRDRGGAAHVTQRLHDHCNRGVSALYPEGVSGFDI